MIKAKKDREIKEGSISSYLEASSGKRSFEYRSRSICSIYLGLVQCVDSVVLHKALFNEVFAHKEIRSHNVGKV